MPRIYTSASDPIDFCKQHFPTEAEAERKYGNLGEGPDGRGNCFSHDAEHPPYEYEEYLCAERRCRKLLVEQDN